MKEGRNGIALPLVCCIPWAFLVLVADLLHSNILWIVVMLLGAVILGLWLRNAGSLPVLVLGNGMSLFFSCLLVFFFQEPQWNAYFKPLGAMGTVILLQSFCLMLQYVVYLWKRERSMVQNFFLALSIMILTFSTLVYGFLCMQAAQFGAI